MRNPLSPLGTVLAAATILMAAAAAWWLRLPSTEPSICVETAAVDLPSGRGASLCEIVLEQQPVGDATWLIVRVVVPDLASAPMSQTDTDTVCSVAGVPRAMAAPELPARIVVQLMATPFVRGEPAPGIAQAIEAYSIADGTCIWELL